MRGPGSVVGIATGYGLDGPGIESRWERDFPHLSRPALEPTQPPLQWVPGLSQGKERPGRDADPSPLLVLGSIKGRIIPLHPLWAVWPVQSLSACTRVCTLLYQQDALYRLIYYSKSALHVSGNVFAHHQEHLTVFTVSAIIHPSYCRLPAGSNLGE